MPKQDTPEWAKKMEDWGKQTEKDWEARGKKIEKPAGYIAAIIVNFILIWVFGQLPEWLPFLTNSFFAVLPLFYISFIATVIANILFLAIDSRVFQGLAKVLLNAWGVVVMISLYFVFPFDFSHYSNANWGLILKIILLVGIFGTVLATIIEFVGAFFGKNKNR